MAETVYVFVRFGKAGVQECRNALCRNRSMLKTCYHGKVIGIGEDVHIKECNRGFWNGTEAVAVLEFENAYWARQWFEGSPDIKQPDWLHGTDVVMAPMREHTPCQQNFVVLVDACIRDSQSFEQYAQQVKDQLRREGGAPAVVATKSCHKFRGLWDPQYLVGHFLSSSEQFQTSTSSDDGKKSENLRQRAAQCDVVAFEIIPL